MLFKETKTQELSGLALDWAVTKCEGFDHETTPGEAWGQWDWATSWAQGAPIIEREGISIKYGEVSWTAETINGTGASGDTPLVAAMRCYVESTLGNTVSIPAELLEVS